MKVIIFLICMTIFFSGCISPQPKYPSYSIENRGNYIVEKNNCYIEDNEEIDYQEMYFEGFEEEQEDLEYE